MLPLTTMYLSSRRHILHDIWNDTCMCVFFPACVAIRAVRVRLDACFGASVLFPIALSKARVTQRNRDVKTEFGDAAALGRARSTEDLGACAAVLLVTVVDERQCTFRACIRVEKYVTREDTRNLQLGRIHLHGLGLLPRSLLSNRLLRGGRLCHQAAKRCPTERVCWLGCYPCIGIVVIQQLYHLWGGGTRRKGIASGRCRERIRRWRVPRGAVSDERCGREGVQHTRRRIAVLLLHIASAATDVSTTLCSRRWWRALLSLIDGRGVRGVARSVGAGLSGRCGCGHNPELFFCMRNLSVKDLRLGAHKRAGVRLNAYFHDTCECWVWGVVVAHALRRMQIVWVGESNVNR
eukprot:m.1294968 g.1294968  ORF g.1294968 m.1294968 type:complete len:351 (-) comp24789_c2_seq24:158-1210(-)